MKNASFKTPRPQVRRPAVALVSLLLVSGALVWGHYQWGWFYTPPPTDMQLPTKPQGPAYVLEKVKTAPVLAVDEPVALTVEPLVEVQLSPVPADFVPAAPVAATPVASDPSTLQANNTQEAAAASADGPAGAVGPKGSPGPAPAPAPAVGARGR